ncbi:hypothetical protein GF312_05670 [Candidatus Poribacteria bacterium]|nr:hypothetical protein [Candidatus Poribacteria bacterium]
MKIESSNIQFKSQHNIRRKESIRESLDIRINIPHNKKINSSNGDTVNLSKKSKKTESLLDEDDLNSALTNELRMIKLLLEKLTGKKIKLTYIKPVKERSPEIKANQQELKPEFGLDYNFQHTIYESEKTNFSAKGIINTSDGKQISFELDLELSREFLQQQNINISAGNSPKLTDPLVINFEGKAAELTDAKFNFDLNIDGKDEQISFVSPGSGFLTIDKNNDGKINNGSELFGPKTGKGFEELAQYDSDGNKWIDENDPIYNDLRIWSKNGGGKDNLFSLKQKGIEAVYLGNQITYFNLNNRQNIMKGQVQSTGVYVNENNSIGTIQQINLVT